MKTKQAVDFFITGAVLVICFSGQSQKRALKPFSILTNRLFSKSMPPGQPPGNLNEQKSCFSLMTFKVIFSIRNMSFFITRPDYPEFSATFFGLRSNSFRGCRAAWTTAAKHPRWVPLHPPKECPWAQRTLLKILGNQVLL
ncbi:MAG: hypothetical protein P8X39_00130, partial [Desulfofustis sp.]